MWNILPFIPPSLLTLKNKTQNHYWFLSNSVFALVMNWTVVHHGPSPLCNRISNFINKLDNQVPLKSKIYLLTGPVLVPFIENNHLLTFAISLQYGIKGIPETVHGAMPDIRFLFQCLCQIVVILLCPLGFSNQFLNPITPTDLLGFLTPSSRWRGRGRNSRTDDGKWRLIQTWWNITNSCKPLFRLYYRAREPSYQPP